MKNSALSSILIYRDQYRRERLFFVRRVFMALALITGASLWVTAILISRPPIFWYAPIASNGVVTSAAPLTAPLKTEAEVKAWTTNAAKRAYRMDFVNFRRDLQSIRQIMTKSGWESYTEDLLRGSRNFPIMKQHKLTSRLEVVGEPKIERHGVFGGTYAWRVNFPVQLIYESSETARVLDADMSVVVVRQPEYINQDGLGISQILARRARSSR